MPPAAPAFKVPVPEHISVVLVTYHPDAGVFERVALVSKQVGHVIIVDNASPNLDVPPGGSIEIIRNHANHGIARALNQGFQRATELGFPWVLTLDQDSTLLPGGLNFLCDAWKDSPNRAKVAVVGSRLRSPQEIPLIEERFPETNRKFIQCKTVITSGSLTRVDVHTEIGGFREDLFIDSVDHDFCLRLRSTGYEIIRATDYSITHRWGRPTVRRLLGKAVNVSNHSATRRYYIARNRLLVAAAHWQSDFFWSTNSLLDLAKETILVLLFETNKSQKLKASAIGLWHGLCGRTGQIAPNLAAQFDHGA